MLTDFQWTSGMIEERKKMLSSKRVVWSHHSLAFELIMVLWAHGYELANFAAEMIRGANPTTFGERSKIGAYYVRQAAGVFDMLEREILPKYRDALLASNPSLAGMPEMYPVMASMMSKYATSIAQIIAIHSSISTKKSDIIIAKLSVHVYKEFDSMLSCVLKFKKKLREQDASLVLDTGLQIIIAQYRILYRAITLQYLAYDSYSHNKVRALHAAVLMHRDLLCAFLGFTSLHIFLTNAALNNSSAAQ